MYLLCLGVLGWDLWHVPGAVAPHLPQWPCPLPFFRPHRLRGAQSCGRISASPGIVTSPQYAHPAGDSLPLLALPDQGALREAERPLTAPVEDHSPLRRLPLAGEGGWLRRGAAQESKRQVRTSPVQQPGDSPKCQSLLGSNQACPGWNPNLGPSLAFLST